MAGDIGVTITGLDQLTARLNQLAQQLPEAVGRELYRDMAGVMAESQQIVPVDTGALRDSGEVDRPETSGGNVSVSLHYGGGSVDYALIQHERLDYHHPNGGSAKFLEVPLHQWADAGPQAVVERAVRQVAR